MIYNDWLLIKKIFLNEGEFSTVLETLDLHSGVSDEDRREFINNYEDQLVKTCDGKNITRDNIFDLINAGERYKLKRLLRAAMKLASKCTRIKNDKRFSDIPNETKVEVLGERIAYLEYNGTQHDIF